MTENYLNYLEEENMLRIFGDTFTLEIKVLRWFPNSQKNIRKILQLAWDVDLDFNIYMIFGQVLSDLIQEQKFCERTGDKNTAKKIAKNIEYIEFWLDSHRTPVERQACLIHRTY